MDLFTFKAFDEEFFLVGDDFEILSLMAKANREFLWGLPAFQASTQNGVWKKTVTAATTNYSHRETTLEWVVYAGAQD